MPLLFLLLFLGIPVIEITVFIKVGGLIGVWPTVAIVILTAVAGTTLLRRQGLSTLFRLRQKLEEDRLPVQEVFDGLCLLIAGALLLTPGFVTDAIGLLLFIPPLRAWLGRRLAKWIIARGEFHVYTGGPGSWSSDDGPVIDGEYDDITPQERERRERRERPRRLDDDR